MLKCCRLGVKKKERLLSEGINAVMNSATKEIDTVGKVTPDRSEIYNDLLKKDKTVLHQCLIYIHIYKC